MRYLAKTPKIVQQIYPNLLWAMPSSSKTVYLTFDDGPTPGVTDDVLKILAEYSAKATFFLVGSNAEKHPEYLQLLSDQGHHIGNHSYSHKNGWRTKNEDYFDDVAKCSEFVESSLFRPPYGKAKRSQLKELNKSYKVVMWDVLSGDFNAAISSEKCIDNVLNNVQNGSIVVFHDSIKAEQRVLNALPKILAFLKNKGFTFEPIPY